MSTGFSGNSSDRFLVENSRFLYQGGQNPTEERTDHNRGQGLQCRICHRFGHIARFCREKGKQGAEAPGRSRQITEASKKPKDSGSSLQVQGTGKVSIQELEQELLQRRLASEQQLADTHVESSANMVIGAVGSSYWLDIAVGGVVAPALVDMRSQSTIILRAFLHKVFAHMKKSGKTPPRLEYPSAKLKGKGGDSIPVTAQVTLRVNVDEKSTFVPAFIQPEGEQECLLGSNVHPALGISVVRANGQPLVPRQDKGGVQVASVNLIQAAAIPGLKGCFVQARVDMVQSDGECLLFEPEHQSLDSLGVSALESLISVDNKGIALVPIQNCQGSSIRLKKGTCLGTIRPIRLWTPEVLQSEGTDSGIPGTEPSSNCLQVTGYEDS